MACSPKSAQNYYEIVCWRRRGGCRRPKQEIFESNLRTFDVVDFVAVKHKRSTRVNKARGAGCKQLNLLHLYLDIFNRRQ